MTQDINILIIGAVIGSVSPLLILIITLYFQNKREVRARQWELEDRQWNRRLDVWGMRIREARDFVDTWHAIIMMLEKLNMTMQEESNIGLPSLMNEATRKGTSITILGDMELLNLRAEINGLAVPTAISIIGLAQRTIEQGILRTGL